MNSFFTKLFCFRAFSSFERKDDVNVKHGFRVTGFYWVYEIEDGQDFYCKVPKRLATHVSGTGVCGIMLPFDKIKLTGFNIKKRWFFRKGNKRYIKSLVKQDKSKYKMIKKFPKGLTSEEFEKMRIDVAIENMTNFFKLKK